MRAIWINGAFGAGKTSVTAHFHELSVPSDELRRRINDQVVIDNDAERDADVRRRSLDQVARCQAAAGLAHVGEAVDNGARPPADTAADILARLRSEPA